MTRYARVHEGVVVEIIELPDGLELADVFHPDISIQCHPCPDGVREGWVYAGDRFCAATVVPVDLDLLKSRLKASIDAGAEVERLKYITPGTGQAITYQGKLEEVRALAQDVDPDPANYPLLSSEIGITAPTLSEVAASVLAASQQWQLIGAAIERVRLGTKAAIDAAETADDASIAAAEVIWPSP